MDGAAGELLDIKRRIVALEDRLARVNDDDCMPGSSSESGAFTELHEPPKMAAFSVFWEDETWKMYFPQGCLLCDGQNPSGIVTDSSGMVRLGDELTSVGIRATWKKNKKTGAISDLAAELSGTTTSSIVVTESGSGADAVYEVTANVPVAKIESFSVIQIANGLISLSSNIGSVANDGKLSVKFGTDAAVQKFSANTDQDATLEFAKVASTGSYNDLADKPTPPTGTVSFVGDMRYDVSTQQQQKRVDVLNLATGAVTPGQWTMITGGQAVPHSGVET